MKYLFILGRNPELSISELRAFFGELDYKKKENAILVEFPGKLDLEIIKKLGGTISIGEVLASGKIEEIEKQLEEKEIYFGKKNNFSFVLYDFSKDTEEIREYLKKRFRKEKLKASEKRAKFMILQDGERGYYSSGLIEEQYFMFDDYFGRIVEECNYDEIEKRDMGKPVRREQLAISPRLAKIMINLSQVKENEILLDPFCGIGVILQEALIQRKNVIGIDNNAQTIEDARKNLEWGKYSERRYKLIVDDSRTVELSDKIHVIVTEPELGKILKKTPNIYEIQKMQRGFEKLMIEVLKHLKKSVNGRVIFTAPFVKLNKGDRIGCSIKNILEDTGLKLVRGFPIADFREEQIVGRQIFVLER